MCRCIWFILVLVFLFQLMQILGSRFTTQSLLLLEKQSAQTLEMTARDCVWQTKTENGWRKVQPELLLQGAAILDVQEVHKHTRDPLNLESVMVLQMSEPEKSGVRKVARLLTHCSPKKYLNFKVKMFDTKDLDYVGGELGSAPRNNNHLSLLSTKLSSMVMQTDTEFQAKLGMQKTFDLKLNQLVLPDPTWNFPNCFKILRCFMV